jgi:hypothetical protein
VPVLPAASSGLAVLQEANGQDLHARHLAGCDQGHIVRLHKLFLGNKAMVNVMEYRISKDEKEAFFNVCLEGNGY